MSQGIYFSANDRVYDWAVAFLNSYRSYNPILPLYLIPFNDQCDRLLQLQATYNFNIYIDASFARLEAIGKSLELGHTPTGPYWFRRYAAFWGPLQRFIYLDARQLVLADLTPVLAALDEHDFEFLHYDCAIDQVYAPGPLRREFLRQGRGRGFLSGLWAARHGLFTLADFEQMAEDALLVRQQLNPRNTDQAFINYCCDRRGVRLGHIAEVLGELCQSAWARQPGAIYEENGCFYRWDYGGQDHKKQVILLHWAGYRLDSRMPEQRLFARFLCKGKINMNKLIWLAMVMTDALWRYPVEWLRQYRLINSAYHHWRRK